VLVSVELLTSFLLRSLDYYLALSGTVPGVGKTLLRECLAHVHKDIVDCWNLRNGHQVSEFWRVALRQVLISPDPKWR
jgi:hypothetical protein